MGKKFGQLEDKESDSSSELQDVFETLPGEESFGKNEIISYDPLDHYLNEIRRIPRLGAEEEKELAIRYREKGDKVAGYKLIKANLRLVVMVAREYRRNLRNMLDLIQEGNIGLLEAIRKYDPYKGTRFPTYAVYWIRAYMLRFLINNIRLVKIGTTQAQRKLFFNLNKEKEKLKAEGFYPEAKLLADRLDVKESEIIEMEQRLALPDLSVDSPIKDHGGPISLDFHSIIPSEKEGVFEKIEREDFSRKIRAIVEKYCKMKGEREIAIVTKRLFTEDPKTLQEIADDFQISRERVRQIESEVKKELKELFSQELGFTEDGLSFTDLE